APFAWDGTVYRARLVTPMLETTYVAAVNGLGGAGALKPGSKAVTIAYNARSANYTFPTILPRPTMTILRDDAAVAYTGDTLVTCGAATCTVHLRAVVSDADADKGDLRNAFVTFATRSATGTLTTIANA